MEDRLEVDGIEEELLKVLSPASVVSRWMDWQAQNAAYDKCDSSGKSASRGVLMAGYMTCARTRDGRYSIARGCRSVTDA